MPDDTMTPVDSNTASGTGTGTRESPGIDASPPVDTDLSEYTAELTVENIGGIDHCTVTFRPGTTILTGENATNRTSLLSALNGALGGSEPTLKSDADAGRVELALYDTTTDAEDPVRTITRTYENGRGTTTVSGDGYIDNPEIVDTFVTILESNDARQAVQHGGDLRDVLMRPVDTGEIERELAAKTSERESLERDLSTLESQIEEEPALIERRESLQQELDAVTSEIDELESVAAEYEADEEMAEEAEALVDELDSKRDEVRDLEDDLEVLESELDAVHEEERELRDRAAELFEHVSDDDEIVELEFVKGDDTQSVPWDEVTGRNRISELEDEVKRLRVKKTEVSATIDDLTRIIDFNKTTVDDAMELPGITDGADDVTAGLAPDSSRDVECWTCGSTISRDTIQSRTSELESYVSEKQSELDDIETELEEKQTELAELRNTRQERKEVRRDLERVRDEQNRIEQSIADTRAELDTARTELQDLQDAVEDSEAARHSDLLDVYEDLSEYEYRRGQIETELDDVADKLDAISDAREEKDAIESDLDGTRDEIKSLRTRIEDLERSAVNAFNDEMETILDTLTYDNIDRVWIERTVSNGAGAVTTGDFNLHIIRTSEDGAAYEDRVETLSESEREVIGVIAAVAGYIVHDVPSIVPFILVDSVEAIDASRLVELINHIERHTTFLAVALLPEDAGVFSDTYDRVTAHQLSTSPSKST